MSHSQAGAAEVPRNLHSFPVTSSNQNFTLVCTPFMPACSGEGAGLITEARNPNTKMSFTNFIFSALTECKVSRAVQTISPGQRENLFLPQWLLDTFRDEDSSLTLPSPTLGGMRQREIWYIWKEIWAALCSGLSSLGVLCLCGGRKRWGHGSGALCVMGQCCCQCYKLPINAKSLQQGCAGEVGNEAGDRAGGMCCCWGCSWACLCGRDREGPSRVEGVAVLGLPGDWDRTGTSPEQFSSFQGTAGGGGCTMPSPCAGSGGPLFSLVTIPVWMERAVSHPCI